ncbi:MAG: DUF6056 family protein [Lachnospiraceae bacterium]|nr:DUF6056 family protein [Lachnospiraceae bacterium]
MRFIKKLFGWTFSEKYRAIGYLAILAVGVGLLIALAKYSVPYYDDYAYGDYTRAGMSSSYDLIGAIKGAANGVKVMWYAWQGTHASIFFMCLVPSVFGEQFYFLGPIFLILLLTGAVFTLTYVVARDVLKADKWNCLALQSLTAGMIILYIHSANQAFYWYNGGFHYTAMHANLMFLSACIVRLLSTDLKREKIAMTLLVILLAEMVGGSNYVTAMQSGLVLVSFALLGILKKKKSTLLLLPGLVAYGISFYYNIFAPGNNVRESHFWYVEETPLMAVADSFKEAVKWGIQFSNWKTLLIVFLIIPVAWSIVKKTGFVFKWWVMLLMMAWSLCFFASSFTASLYATGEVVLARVINNAKMNYHLMLVLNVVYVVGFIYQLVQKKSKNKEKNLLLKWKGGFAWPLIIAWVGAFFFFYTNEVNPIGNYTVFGATYYLANGTAEQFYDEYEQRLEILKDDSIKDVVFEPYKARPWFLINKDIGTNPSDEENVFLAEYYNKNSVCVKE